MFHAAIDEACGKPDESHYKIKSDDVDWDDWENWDQLGTVSDPKKLNREETEN